MPADPPARLLDRAAGLAISPPGWFAVEGIIDGQVVPASWTDGRLACNELLRSRGALLVDLEEEFVSADPRGGM